jgi:hypothetical protein
MDLIPYRGDAGCFTTGFMGDQIRGRNHQQMLMGRLFLFEGVAGIKRTQTVCPGFLYRWLMTLLEEIEDFGRNFG